MAFDGGVDGVADDANADADGRHFSSGFARIHNQLTLDPLQVSARP